MPIRNIKNILKMYKKSKIFITGSNGMLGSALVTQLQNREYINLFYPNSKQLNLMKA